MREAALTCARPVSSGRQNELEADAELFLKPILPQMNQRLFEILLRIEQLHTGISLGLSAPEEPPPPSMWGDHAPAVSSQGAFQVLTKTTWSSASETGH